MNRVNLAEKFRQFDEHWTPKIVGELNDSYVKLVKVKGEFVWHHHELEDELFLVVKGRLLLKFRDRDVWVGEGEFVIVPRGVEHRPVASEEAHILLLEPKSTLNTGNVRNERTISELDRISKGDAYAAYLRRTGVPECRATPGNRGVEVLRRTAGGETHFLFISLWDSMDAIRTFAGDDVERARYYPEDREYLLELEPTVTHYEVSEQ